MQIVTVTEFAAQCLQLIDHVEATREPVVVMQDDKPIVKLLPIDDEAHHGTR